MIHANDLSIAGAEFLEESFHFLAVLETLFITGQMGRGLAFGRLGQLPGWGPFHDLMNDDSSCDHREVRGQTALPAEVSKHSEIVTNEREKDLGAEIVSIIRSQGDVASVCRVANDVNDEAQEAIDEIVPRPGLALQASFQQVSIDFRECHRWYPRVF